MSIPVPAISQQSQKKCAIWILTYFVFMFIAIPVGASAHVAHEQQELLSRRFTIDTPIVVTSPDDLIGKDVCAIYANGEKVCGTLVAGND